MAQREGGDENDANCECTKNHWFSSIVFGIVWIENVLMTHSIKGYFSMEIAKSRWISINVIYYNFNDIVRGTRKKAVLKAVFQRLS